MIEEVNNSEIEPPYYLNRNEKLKWLMRTYGNDVIRVAYTYLKQKQLAEDVAQDVFIKCYEKMDTFRNDSSYKTWIIKITVNRCKDILKSWSYKNLLITNYFENKKVVPSSQLQRDEESQVLSQQLMELPVKLREVIILYYYQEFTIEEISVLLNAKPNTIKTRLHRARLHLKKLLEGASSINEW
ncbi:sigma-70 family RNA polymerase sigma factor [Lederbergia wuyishanensis]|uniref:RNA polymerase sigma-70 factor (ECF subfamily) n=1 Tax=Lederbergia wuyishanensis TaxID=1347903 RepID=A0ABU0D693_9BACI|nr:sigma-70 family RNA polymerase sigma factor [Lederbergia wuyishanensis]MCJ8008693.1 sigma-70 family RNA polymerase sigma factor [Lederbergia wuyishanensis]MDQ0343888.1 RNA polymerase sigma-70 factor (ECF subfamily) [Lederbergia wuyishanensis]